MPVLPNNNRRHEPSPELLNLIQQIAERFYTTQQVADSLNVKLTSAQRYCNGGEFPHAIQIGRDWLVPIEDIEAYRRDRLGKMGRPRINEPINREVKPKGRRKQSA